MKFYSKIPLGLTGLALTLLMVACGGGGGGSENLGSDSANFATGTLKVALTDMKGPDTAPSELWLSIEEIRAVPEEDGEQMVLATYDPPLVIDVLSLQYEQLQVAVAELPPDTYNQIRLILTPNDDPENPANYLVYEDEPEVHVPLKTPSGQQSGVKGKFVIEPGETTTVVLDIDPVRAVVEAGDMKILKPTGIRLVLLQEVLPEYGALFGTIELGEEVGAEAVPGEAPEVIVRVFDADENEVASSGILEDGTFRIFVPSGFYFVTVETEGYETYESPQAFEVIEGEETVLVPIVLTPVGEEVPPEIVPEEVPPEIIPEEVPPEEIPVVEEEIPVVEEVLAPATVRFWLADTLTETVEEAYVSLSDIMVHQPGAGWFGILEGPQEFELTEIPAEGEILLGELMLDPGKITMIRFNIEEASIVVEGVEYPVKVPSNSLKLNRNVEVCSGGEVDIVIDLGAQKSLKFNAKKEKYNLKPVPKAVEVETSCPEPEEPVVEEPPVEEPPVI